MEGLFGVKGHRGDGNLRNAQEDRRRTRELDATGGTPRQRPARQKYRSLPPPFTSVS